MDTYLGVEEEVIKTALSVSIKAHTDAEELRFVESKIGNGPSQLIVAFPGSWSPNHWLAEDSEAKPFGETMMDNKKFPSVRSLSIDCAGKVNKAFMARFLSFLDEGSHSFFMEVEKAVKDNKQIIFTGHSSGGPIATYATVWFLEEYIRQQKHTLRPLCLTFGSPISTDRIFCHAIQREGWSDCFVHFVGQVDIVPRILLAPLPSERESLEKILSLFNPHYDASSSDKTIVESLFKNVMKNASRVASHAAHVPRGRKHTLFDTMSRFLKLSPYRPCGKYVFCTDTGKLVIEKNPDAVLQLLFYSLQNKSGTELQNAAAASLEAHWTYKDALDKSLAPHNVVCLENLRELPLSSDDAALNDLNLSEPARLFLRAVGELEKRKLDNQKWIEDQKGTIEKCLDTLEKYQTASKYDDEGYYDAFKLQKKEVDFRADMRRRELASIWDEIFEKLRRCMVPARFAAEREWVGLATRYRQIVEPMDIANYYRHSRNDEAGSYMSKGRRPSRYEFIQRWQEHDEQLEKDSCCESYFWAEVEDLKVASTKLPWVEIKSSVLDLERRLENWYEKNEDKGGMFLEKSTLVQWWRSLPEDHKLNSRIKGFMPRGKLRLPMKSCLKSQTQHLNGIIQSGAIPLFS